MNKSEGDVTNHERAPWSGIALNTKETRTLAVCRRGDGSELSLPMLVARGAVEEGPTLVVLGGVHGDEYEGPLAIWKTFESLETARLSGTLVMMPVTNVPAYEAGRRVNPADPKDLARTFPGSMNGSVTERIAYLVGHELIARASFLCDLHSAGEYYQIDPWVGYALVSDGNVLETQRRAARLVGYPTVWGTALLPGRTLAFAADRGIPAIYVEAPGEGRVRSPDVARNLRVVRQLLRFLGMIDEPVEPFEPERVVEDFRADSGYLQVQWLAECGGLFLPAIGVGDSVREGDEVGGIHDPAGREIVKVVAPCSGRVVFLRTFPLVRPGDSLGTILEIQHSGVCADT